LEDYCSPPPPLSQSAPELNATLPEAPLMRHAASSTELLYERAMARFYKAVEIEQHETARRRSISVDIEARRRSMSYDQEPKLATQMNRQEPKLMDVENSSLLKRRFSDDNNLSLKIKLPKKFDSFDDENEENDETQWNTIKNEVNTPDMIDSSSKSPLNAHHEENFEEDYTASTLSSDAEGEVDMDEEIPTRRSKHRGQTMETHHHPRMLSPYRQPDNSEAAAVLTKPLVPLPDPNFKPKPILKRPASADGRRSTPLKLEENNLFERRSVSPSPLTLTQKQHRKSVEIDVVPKIMFENNDTKKDVEQKKEDEKISPPTPKPVVEEVKEEEIDPELEYKRELARQRSEEQAKRMLQLRQTSLEENRVMADFYGDIIKDVSRPISKPKIPIYMDPEALKKLQMYDDEDDKTENDSGITSSNDLSPPSSTSKPFSSKVEKTVLPTRTFSPPPVISNLIPRMQVVNAPEIVIKSNTTDVDESDNIDKEKLINDIQTRGRTIVPKSTTSGLKKRDQSHSRTRDSSVARQEITTKNPAESTILRRREKSLSRTRNRSESKSPAAMNRKIIINKVVHPKVALDVPSTSQEQSRPMTPVERQEEVDLKVKSSMSNMTDVTILIFASYLYFFKSALLALPILMLLVYRQISDKFSWLKRKKS
jgi:titin